MQVSNDLTASRRMVAYSKDMIIETLHKLRMMCRASIVTGCLLIAAIAPLAMPSVPAYAITNNFAAAFLGKCSLPDGGTGYIEQDGLTCCPAREAGANQPCLFSKYINPLIQLLSGMVGLIIAGGIIFGGIEYIMSEGDPQKATSGKKHITNALFALVAFLLLYAFLQFIIPGGVLNG